MEKIKCKPIEGFIPVIYIIFLSLVFFSCSLEEKKDINSSGNNTQLSAVRDDQESMIVKGRFLYTKKCLECHDLDIKLKGPALRDITKRRKAEWILNMVLNTDEMLKKDPEAKILFKKHVVKMVVKDIDEEQAKSVLEYLRSVAEND